MKYKIIILIIISLFCTGKIILADNAGRTSAQFLKISPSPRAISLGNAYSAIADDADSLYYNPASVSFIKNPDISISYTLWLQSMNYMSAFGVIPLKNAGTIGIGVFGLYDSDIIKTSMDSFGNIDKKSGTITAGDYCFIGSYGINLIKSFSIGLNVKGIYQTLEEESSFSFAGDMGIFLSVNKNKTRIGFSVQNIGSKSKFVKDEFDLPLGFRMGLSQDLILDKKNILMLALEGQKTIYESFGIGMGMEYSYNKMIFARIGYEYQDNSDSMGLKAGFGFAIKNLKVNYGFDLFNNLGTTHSFQVNIPFGQVIKVAMGEEEVLSPEEQDALDNGDDYILNNEYSEALPYYLKAIKLNPNHTRAAYNIACIYSVNSDAATAVLWLDYVLKLDNSPGMLSRIKNDSDFDQIKNSQAFINFIDKYTVKQPQK